MAFCSVFRSPKLIVCQILAACRTDPISTLSLRFFYPKFRLQSIDHELQLFDEHKEGLKNEITGTVVGVTL